MKRTLLTITLAALTIGLLGSCKKEDPKVAVTGVTLDKTELTLTVGDPDVKLTATVAPENATDKTVIWSSNKTEFAIVDNQGNVHAVAPGTANITVTTTDGGKTATCAVIVKAALPTGALPGVFSVSATKQVHFSQGNLWYGKVGSATTETWNFETNQYDSTPAATGNWDASHVSHFFWSKSESVAYAETYSESGTSDSDVFFTNAEAETAKSNFTVNGVTGKYRTLSTAEWQYLFNTRTVNGGTKEGYSYQRATINSDATSVYGMILYPDDYSSQTGVASYTSAQWTSMEAKGCVFLPAAGSRFGSFVNYVGVFGSYWSSSAFDEISAYYVDFESSNVFPDLILDRLIGYSVRLITESK